MSRLTRDGTAEPLSRDQILRHARGQGNIIFPVQLTTSRIGDLTRLIHTLLYVMTIHTYMHTYILYEGECRKEGGMTRRLTRDGTAEPVARDDILWRERGQEKCNFLSFSFLQMMSWQRHLVDPYHTLLEVLTIHTYI